MQGFNEQILGSCEHHHVFRGEGAGNGMPCLSYRERRINIFRVLPERVTYIHCHCGNCLPNRVQGSWVATTKDTFVEDS